MRILSHPFSRKRLTWTFVMLSCCLYSTAQTGYAYTADRKGPFKNLGTANNQTPQGSEKQTLFNVLKDLNKQKGVYFLFSDPSLGNKPVNAVTNNNAAIEKILDQVLKNTGLKYKKVSEKAFVILSAKENPRKASQEPVNFEDERAYQDNVPKTEQSVNEVITGRITTAEGAPVSGVSVAVKGTRRGTSTNANGEFSIEAEKGETLVFSYVGFATQEVVVGSDTRLSIVLQQSNSQMNEVVVTALGIRKESKRLGYSVTKVEGEGLTKAREINVANGLVGKVAGVNVSGVNGGPGSSSNIRIRGGSSLFGNNQPLYVINGVPMDNSQRHEGTAGMWGGADMGDGISNINPDDIEEISVLKGSTASALYGSLAKNGVILITTKSGKNRKGIGVEFNSNFTVDKIIDHTDFQYEYGQGTLGMKPANANAAYVTGTSSWGGKIDGSNSFQFDGVQRPYVAHEDNIRNFYRTGTTATNTLAFFGGGENVNYRLSASNLMNQSVVPNSNLKRNTFNLNLNTAIAKRLSLSIIVNYVLEKSKNRPNLSDSPGNSNFGILFLPTTLDQEVLKPGYNEDGSEINLTENIYLTNPWFAANKFVNDLSRNRVISSATARYEVTSWLSAQGRIGYDLYNDRRTTVTPNGTAYLPTGSMTEHATRYSELNADFLFNIQRNIAKDVHVDVNLGGNIRKTRQEILTQFGENFSIPFLYTISNARATRSKNLMPRRETQSLYYTLELSYRNMLFLTTTGREDWFSTLPINNNHLFYPSVSGSFVFSEVFKPSWLSFGKVRVAWANTSGEADPYKIKLTYNLDGTINGNPIGVLPADIPNSALEPFRLREFETGLELKLFNNRLAIDLAWFNRKTMGEIIPVPTSIASGFTSATVNVGDWENKGVEVLVSGTPVKTGRFSWVTSVNVTKLNAKVLKLADGQTNAAIGESRTQNAYIHHVVGKAPAQVMAFDFKRDASGQIIYDADGRPLQGLLTAYGSGMHDLYGGWNNEFNYGNFNFGVLIDFKSGGKIFSATNSYATVFGLHKMTLPGRETGIVGEGVNEGGGKNTVKEDAWDYYPALAGRVSSQFVYDASFIKLRQIVLGYNLPQSWFRRIGVQGVQLALVGRNLAILKKHTPNIDPESNYSNVNAQGLELAGVPPFRSFGLNLNVKL
ncbi:MAG TPA: SusC/RagA family TonB-linked outer membrane protein [Chitinophagaceae bacterium]|nr:SusC/RagA family TonB-linked outer membrane protein [Chitinophagaceae bacterium]